MIPTSVGAPKPRQSHRASVAGRESLYAEALPHARSLDDARRIRALVPMHLAVENVLKTVVAATGVALPDNAKFHELVKACRRAVPSAGATMSFRQAQNAAQHEGVAPADVALSEAVKVIRACLVVWTSQTRTVPACVRRSCRSRGSRAWSGGERRLGRISFMSVRPNADGGAPRSRHFGFGGSSDSIR